MNLPYRVIGSRQLMRRIIKALDDKKPLSVVSLGATETYVMAQYTVLSEKEFMNHSQAKSTNANKSHRGFKFPNKRLRDELLAAAKKASIIGYPYLIRNNDAGLMTEKVLKKCGIKPKLVFESNIRRVIMFSQSRKFKEMLKGRKILLIGRLAAEAKRAMDKKLKDKLGFEVVGTIGIDSYDDVPNVKKQIDKYNFDLCLISAGVYAVILAPYIAEKHRKVAVDLGQGLKSFITGEVEVTSFVRNIGLRKLMKM